MIKLLLSSDPLLLSFEYGVKNSAYMRVYTVVKDSSNVVYDTKYFCICIGVVWICFRYEVDVIYFEEWGEIFETDLEINAAN